MRIAFLGDGSLNHIRRWAGYFHARGHDVLLLSFEDVEGCPFPAEMLPKRLPTKLAGYLASIHILRNRLQDFGPELLNPLYVSGYGFIGSLSGFRPLVISALGSDLLVDYRSSPLHRAQIRYALGKADLVTVDADNLSMAAAEAGVPAERIIKAYFGIDRDLFHPPGEKDRAAAPVVVSTRNLYDVYNISLLLEAAPLILEETEVSFTICGDGPLRGELERKASHLGLSDSITFTGKLAPVEIADRLRDAAVYVSTSLSDSTSVSLLEAMACGAVPVVTDIEANREWIRDGENGFLVKPDDPRQLAGAVIRAVSDAVLAAEFASVNSGIITEKGLWESNMERIENAFTGLVQQGGHWRDE